MSLNSMFEASWFYPLWDVTLVLGIYSLDNHLRSLWTFQACLSPVPHFQLVQSASVYLSNTGGWFRPLILAWWATSGKNENLIIFSQIETSWMSLSKYSEHSSPSDCQNAQYMLHPLGKCSSDTKVKMSLTLSGTCCSSSTESAHKD